MEPAARRPIASVSLDLDNQWAYMRTHGDPGWESLPSYLDAFVPYVLDALRELELTITFFLVGQDAALESNRAALAALTAAGHEVGNHSFHHLQWFHTFPRAEIRREIRATADAIERVTGKTPQGYRGPGFSWSEAVFEELADAGYAYDASTLPTYLGPLARMYYFRTSKLSEEEMAKRRKLFGELKDGRRPLRPYVWSLASGKRLLEIPVTTVPGLKTPFHLSYLLYLSRFSMLAMSLYLKTAIRLCRLTGTEPSFLLHPLDLLGADRAPGLAFFPGMDLSATHKREVFFRALRELQASFALVPLGEHARRATAAPLPVRSLRAGVERVEAAA